MHAAYRLALTMLVPLAAAALLGAGTRDRPTPGSMPAQLAFAEPALDPDFLVKPSEIKRDFRRSDGALRLAFKNYQGTYGQWRDACKAKLTELLNVKTPRPCTVQELRQTVHEGVRIKALVMKIDETLSIPGYLLVPEKLSSDTAVMAIHGHGEVGPCLGERDDPHRRFALRLAQAGYLVLCPEIRGFGVLDDLAADRAGSRLDYWNKAKRVNDRQFTLVTDGLLHGNPVMGEHIEDLLRWEDWLAESQKVKKLHVAGLSYGGDLALAYPVFSQRVDRIFASGTFGSFSVIYTRCYLAPAHCIPNVLNWLDRADIAGLNAPRPTALHFGELDTVESKNNCASYNETVPGAFKDLQKIYAAAGAENKVRLLVSKGKSHEMDNDLLLSFLKDK
jgi:dienelactone hydrolase